jgi:hypothetical protein
MSSDMRFLRLGRNDRKVDFSKPSNIQGGFAMKCNIGKTDRIVRVIIGLAIIWAGFYYENWWGVVGIVPLATAIIGHCPAYVPFKFSTCRKED